MRLYLGILISIVSLLSCRSVQTSSVKDVLYQGKAGAMLFYRDGNDIKIKPCANPATITAQTAENARTACELKAGEKIESVSANDFKADLLQGLKLQMNDPATLLKVEEYKQEQLAEIARQKSEVDAAQRVQLTQDIKRVEDFLSATEFKQVIMSTPRDALERIIANSKSSLSSNKEITQAELDPANALVAQLVDELISKPGVVIINASSGTDLFFGLLESYITKDWVAEENTSSPDRFEFIVIKAGKFMMGSPKSEVGRSGDEIQHEVTITKSFKMSKYEVTQAQWTAVMGKNPSRFKGDDLPVETVSWDDAQAFIAKLNDGTDRCGDTSTKAGFDKAWSTSGCYRLPTEAEWEYAARAGTTTPFYTKTKDKSGREGWNITTDQANYDGDHPYNNNAKGQYREKTVSVNGVAPSEHDPLGLDPANPWGLMHMSGNVWEWNQDYYVADYNLRSTVDPKGAATGSDCSVRGGSWYNYARLLRSANRLRLAADVRLSIIGLRLVRTL